MCLQADLQRLLSQEVSLKQQVAAVQERITSMERTRASDKAFLQVCLNMLHSTCCTATASKHMPLVQQDSTGEVQWIRSLLGSTFHN